jgi:DNA/RNA endonuclease YhcR with UshA esterase domain
MSHRLLQKWAGTILVAALLLSSILSFAPNAAYAANSDGSLTVAEAIANNTGSGTVEGYIVGHATGSLTANFQAPFTNDFNFLIADSPSEQSNAKLLDVQITAAYRSQFGLQTNPSLIGSKVKVTGMFAAYNNYAGVKSPTALSLIDEATTPDPGDGGGTTDPEPPAPTLPDGTGKKVLFDHSHGQSAGAADWVIDGGFSDFADGLRGAGFTVESLDRAVPFTFSEQAVTYEKLSQYDVFIIGEANIPYKQSEQAAMLQYVHNGGSIFFIADHYNADRNKNRWDASEVMNGYRRGAWDNPAKGMTTEEAASPAMQDVQSADWLADNFGVRFRYNALGDVDNMTDVVAPNQAFGITSGVASVAMHAGSTIAILDPTKAKGLVYVPTNVPAWANAVDNGVYNGGGRAEGPFAAVSKVGAGKAAFIGDSSPVEDATPKYLREENGAKKTTYDGFNGEANDAAFLVNTVKWLANHESYTSLSQVAGLELDQPTQLLASEAPAQSTEPQAEPWAAPAVGYKWYDPTTFKPGSYGSTTAPAVEAQYAFVHQATLPNAVPFQIRVTVDNLLPGQTVTGLTAGIYLAGGTQVAKFQNADGSWPTAYGYSASFSITADSTGHAYKDLTVQLNPSTSGSANLRLKVNGNNEITKAVTVGNVAAEPLPENQTPVPAKISIADARLMADNSIVTVEGIITSEPGAFGGQGFYVQDGTAGIYVYQTSTGYHAGDTIKISAIKTVYNTEVELSDPIKLEKTGTGSIPVVRAVTSLGEDNQGQLVRLDNVIIQNYITGSPAGSFEFDAVNGMTSTHVRIDVRTGISQTEFRAQFPAGTVVNLSGVSSIFKGTYQLKPLSLLDVTPVDTVAPTASVAYSTTAPTNQEVIATITPSEPVTITNNGGSSSYTFTDNGSFTFEFIDAAGNAGTATATVNHIDRTAPTVVISVDTPVIHQSDHKMVPVNVTVDAADNGSGIASIVLASVTSNEPDNGTGDGSTVNDIQDAEIGTYDTSISLRAERSGNGNGRIYTITYRITDLAGNITMESVDVSVPHGK